MKKTYLLEGLDCANCAAEVERNVAKLDNVNSASVNFLTLKMVPVSYTHLTLPTNSIV